jgi:hypothetical protein
MNARIAFLERIADLLIDDILATAEEELQIAIVNSAIDPDEETEKMRRLIALAAARALQNAEEPA